MEDKNLFNKLKNREDLNIAYEYEGEDDGDEELEDYDDERDFDDYNDGDWDEDIY